MDVWTVCKNISYFGVRSLMNDSLSGRPETLAAFGAGVRLGTRVDSLMNILERWDDGIFHPL